MDDYVKVVYQSEPIGEERIILYLTTFDIEAFNKNVDLDEIPTKKEKIIIELPAWFDGETAESIFSDYIEEYIDEIYGEQIREMKDYIEAMRKIKEIEPLRYSAKIENKGWVTWSAVDLRSDKE